jgi:DUF1365 family protein
MDITSDINNTFHNREYGSFHIPTYAERTEGVNWNAAKELFISSGYCNNAFAKVGSLAN